MGYFYECPRCGNVHDFNPTPDGVSSELPERHCQHCDEQGCVDCIRDGGCSDCDFNDFDDFDEAAWARELRGDDDDWGDDLDYD